MGVGLNASLSKLNPDEPVAPEFENETTTSPAVIFTTGATTSTAEVSKKNSKGLKPESFVAFLGVFSSRLARLWPVSVDEPIPVIPSSTDTTVVNISSMERLEITSQHITVWNSWSECNPTNSCLDADSSGETCVKFRYKKIDFVFKMVLL